MISESRSERFRPQVHFSMRAGWINDPNDLVFYDGVYHLFCQHNPDDTRWGPMHWSHATSADLIHWQEQEIALHPDRLGTIYSGSAVVDWQNSSDLSVDGAPPLLAFYTAAGNQVTPQVPYTQCLAYSTDKGSAWQKYEGNPILQQVAGGNRDPKVFWHAPTDRWIMVLYLTDGVFGLFGSPDAVHWEELSRFEVQGNCECPDLFEMPVDGDETRRKWIFLSGAGRWFDGDCTRYVIGSFDGVSFTAESEPLPIEWGGWNYSTQTYSDTPDGRRVLVSWFSTQFDGSAAFPGNPFNGQYRIPWMLNLVETAAGLRLSRQPIEEVSALRETPLYLPVGAYAAGRHAVGGLDCRSLDITCVLEPGAATAVGLQFEGVDALSYDIPSQTMRVLDRTHPWSLEPDGTLAMRVLFDVNCLEVFDPAGLKVMSSIYALDTLAELDATKPLPDFVVEGGDAFVKEMVLYPLRSIWEN